MTIRPRAARSVRDLRTRLRDMAAASHANTVAARDLSRDALEDCHDQLARHLDGAHATLARARSIYELQRVDENTGVHRIAIADASRKLDEDTKQTQISETALRERARQLRAAEKLVEKLEKGIASRESANEQRANDDINSRRR